MNEVSLSIHDMGFERGRRSSTWLVVLLEVDVVLIVLICSGDLLPIASPAPHEDPSGRDPQIASKDKSYQYWKVSCKRAWRHPSPQFKRRGAKVYFIMPRRKVRK